MLVKIEDKIPYQDSIIWNIQDNYYNAMGINAWKKGELAFNPTSNLQAAYQNAKVVFQTIATATIQRTNPNEKIYILELGSGIGIFALNFLKAFKEICKQENKDYYKKIKYLVTNYSETTLKEISQNKYFNELKQENLLDFYLLDALNPQKIQKLSGEVLELKNEMFTAIIANNLYSTLPIAVIKKSGNDYYERNIEILYKTNKEILNYKEYVEKSILIPESAKFIDNLDAKLYYKKIDINTYIKDKTELSIFNDLTKNLKKATVSYPFTTLKSLKALTPLIKKNGIMLISDKGYANREHMWGDREDIPSASSKIYPHSLNIPFVESFANKLALSVLRTSNSYYNIQTILLVKAPLINKFITKTFTDLFIDLNLSEDLNYFYNLAYSNIQKKDIVSAINALKKALECDPSNPSVFYTLGTSYFNGRDYVTALEYYEKGLEYKTDYFNIHNFHFQIAKCYIELKKFEKAIEYCYKSMLDIGEQENIIYTLGFCWEMLGKYDEAFQAYTNALIIAPKYQPAKSSVERILKLKK